MINSLLGIMHPFLQYLQLPHGNNPTVLTCFRIGINSNLAVVSYFLRFVVCLVTTITLVFVNALFFCHIRR